MTLLSILIKKLLHGSRKLRRFYFIYWNRLKFIIWGIQFGKNMKVFNKHYLNLGVGAKIIIGDDFTFSSGAAFNPLCRNIRGMIFANEGSTITIGNNTGMSSTCLCANKRIVIGNWVKIGGDCIIMDTDAHNLDWQVRCSGAKDVKNRSLDSLTAKSAPFVIENRVLIGARCIVMKGGTIGARSVIGADSVVVKSIPPDCIAAGNPCKVIRNICKMEA